MPTNNKVKQWQKKKQSNDNIKPKTRQTHENTKTRDKNAETNIKHFLVD